MFDIIIKKHGTDKVLKTIEDVNTVVGGYAKEEDAGHFALADANSFDIAVALHEATEAIETITNDEPAVEKALRFIAIREQEKKAEREG